MAMGPGLKPASGARPRGRRFAVAALVLLMFVSFAPARGRPQAPAGPDHEPWTRLLERFVTADSRVNYGEWKKTETAELDAYLASLAQPWPAALTDAGRKAALINAYNALTLRWVLQHYPEKSIWRTPDPFRAERHTVNGRKVSLDGIENELRATGDARIHAALVCAARSCPPLRREAYTAGRVEQQLDENMRAWLANPALNQFAPAEGRARISSIFNWYGKDFGGGRPALLKFLARYAPPAARPLLESGKARVNFLRYHWGLNDTGDLGSDYSHRQFLWDRVRNVF